MSLFLRLLLLLVGVELGLDPIWVAAFCFPVSAKVLKFCLLRSGMVRRGGSLVLRFLQRASIWRDRFWSVERNSFSSDSEGKLGEV